MSLSISYATITTTYRGNSVHYILTFIMFHFKTKWFGLTLLQPSIGNAKTSRYTISHLLLKWTATIDRFNYVFVRILVIFVSWLQTKTSALKVSYLCILIPIFMLMTSIANDQCGFSRNFHVSFSLKYLLIWRKKSFLNFKFTSFLFGFKFFSKGEGVHRSGASRLISQALVSVTKFNST